MSGSTNDSTIDSFDHLLDIFLYAPIGLLSRGAESFPDLAKRGRSNAANARVIGQFALGASNTKARTALADAEKHIAAFMKIVNEAATPKRPAANAAADVHDVAETLSEDHPSINDLIDGYESFTAATILPLLANLSTADLVRVEQFERSNRNRKTILNRIRQLQG